MSLAELLKIDLDNLDHNVSAISAFHGNNSSQEMEKFYKAISSFRNEIYLLRAKSHQVDLGKNISESAFIDSEIRHANKDDINNIAKIMAYISHTKNSMPFNNILAMNTQDREYNNKKEIEQLTSIIEKGFDPSRNENSSFPNFLARILSNPQSPKNQPTNQIDLQNSTLKELEKATAELSSTCHKNHDNLKNIAPEETVLLNFHINQFIDEIKKYNTAIINSDMPDKTYYLQKNLQNIQFQGKVISFNVLPLNLNTVSLGLNTEHQEYYTESTKKILDSNINLVCNATNLIRYATNDLQTAQRHTAKAQSAAK